MKIIKSHSSFFLMFFIAIITCKHVSLAECDNVKDYCPTIPPQKQTIFLNGFPSCENPNNTIAHDFKSMELSQSGSRDKFGSLVKIVTAYKFTSTITLEPPR